MRITWKATTKLIKPHTRIHNARDSILKRCRTFKRSVFGSRQPARSFRGGRKLRGFFGRAIFDHFGRLPTVCVYKYKHFEDRIRVKRAYIAIITKYSWYDCYYQRTGIHHKIREIPAYIAIILKKIFVIVLLQPMCRHSSQNTELRGRGIHHFRVSCSVVRGIRDRKVVTMTTSSSLKYTVLDSILRPDKT